MTGSYVEENPESVGWTETRKVGIRRPRMTSSRLVGERPEGHGVQQVQVSLIFEGSSVSRYRGGGGGSSDVQNFKFR